MLTWPKKSLHLTPDGVVSSAGAGHVVVPAWLSFSLGVMSRAISTILFLVALILFIRAGQIHMAVWQAAEARKDLLAHFVDHAKTLTEHRVQDAQFLSRNGEYSQKTFAWYFIGGLCAAGVAQWFDRRRPKPKV